jgi:HPt (histidine-containing phosphotransfer) domain-containing protein
MAPMQADLVDRYLSRVHGVFEHLSEINHERSRFELDRDDRMRLMQLAIESAQQEIDQRSDKLGLIRGAVKIALESIPSHRDSNDSELAGGDQSGDEEVDTELAKTRLVSRLEALQRLLEALQRLVARAKERQEFFSSRRSEIQQSLDLVNSKFDEEVGVLNRMKSSLCAKFPHDVSHEAANLVQNSSEYIEIMSVEQFRELVAQWAREAPSTRSIHALKQREEALRLVVFKGLKASGLPVSIGLYFLMTKYIEARCPAELHGPCPGGGWFVNFLNNSEFTQFFVIFFPVFLIASFCIGIFSTPAFLRALKNPVLHSDSRGEERNVVT